VAQHFSAAAMATGYELAYELVRAEANLGAENRYSTAPALTRSVQV